MIELRGTAADRGGWHGAALRAEIHRVLQRREQELRAAEAVKPDWIREVIDFHRQYDGALFEETEALARGAGIPLEQAFYLNGYQRYAVERAKRIRQAPASCTVFAVADSETWLAQQWDFQTWLQPYTHFWLHHLPDGRRILVGGFAGCIGLFGMNSDGIGIVLNNLPVTSVRLGVGSQFLTRRVLAQQTFADAAAVLRAAPASTCQNFLLAGPDGCMLDAELAVAGPVFTRPSALGYVHANHYQAPSLIRFNNQPAPDPGCCEPGQTTFFRESRLAELLRSRPQPLDAGSLQEYLCDHANAPASICVHDFQGGNTNASLLMNLDRREAWCAVGNPCTGGFSHIRLSG